ncbi:MAG: winged helix-turn-helix domain-containing protein [Pararhodobacter sp.]
MTQTTPPPDIRLRLAFAGGLAFGPGKAELLRQIARTGSISAAGRAMGMSYKRAWSLVEEMNTGFAAPLVASARGGAGGGGASLTETGAAVLRHYEACVDHLRTDGADALAALAGLVATDMSGGR